MTRLINKLAIFLFIWNFQNCNYRKDPCDAEVIFLTSKLLNSDNINKEESDNLIAIASLSCYNKGKNEGKKTKIKFPGVYE